MRKLGKILGLLVIVLVMSIALTTNVKAATTVDLTGYNEIGGEDEITTTNTTNTTDDQEQKQKQKQNLMLQKQV